MSLVGDLISGLSGWYFRRGLDKGAIVTGPIHIYGDPKNISVVRAKIHAYCVFITYENSKIKIGRNVNISPGCVLTTTGLDYKVEGWRPHKVYGDVILGDNVWLGANSTLIGVTIGDNSVVAAGSVVVDDVPANTLVGGVPAKVIA